MDCVSVTVGEHTEVDVTHDPPAAGMYNGKLLLYSPQFSFPGPSSRQRTMG